MTFGNLSWMMREMPSMYRVMMIVLPPVPIKNHRILQRPLDEQRQQNRKVLNNVLWSVLRPLTFKKNPNAQSEYFNVTCIDGNFRCCKSDLAAWHAVALSIATYIISSGMSALGASVQRMNLNIMSHLTSNTPGGISTNKERTVMKTPRQPMLDCHRAPLRKNEICFDMFQIS